MADVLSTEHKTPEATVWGAGAPQVGADDQWPLNYEYAPPLARDNADLVDTQAREDGGALPWQWEGYEGGLGS